MVNYYEILNVDPHAAINDIKKSFRKLALKYHPDVNPSPDAKSKFIEIYEAYEILSNPDKRNKYDTLFFSEDNIKPIFREEYIRWKYDAQKEGNRFSNMKFNQFKESVLDGLIIVYEGTKKASKIGCLSYFGLTFLGVGLYSLYASFEQYIEVFSNGKEFHIGLVIGPLFAVIFIWIGIMMLKSLKTNN